MSTRSRRDSAMTKARSLFRPRSRSKSRNGSVGTVDGSHHSTSRSTSTSNPNSSSTPASHERATAGATALPGLPSLELSLGVGAGHAHPTAIPASAPPTRTATTASSQYPPRRTSLSLPFEKSSQAKSNRASLQPSLSSAISSGPLSVSGSLSHDLDTFLTGQHASSSATDLRPSRLSPANAATRSHPPVSSSAFLAQNSNPSAMDAGRKVIRRKFKAPTVLNIVLAGAKGTGKSTFAKTFLETCDLSLCDESVRRDVAKFCSMVNTPLMGKARRAREAQSQKPLTLAGIEIRAGDSLDGLDAVLQAHMQLQMQAQLDRAPRPGSAMAMGPADGENRLRRSSDAPSTTSVQSVSRRAPRMLQLSLIDCPGFNLPRTPSSGGKVSAADELAVELALQPLLEIIQGRFSASLGEEVKVSRTKQEDNHIHAVLYFIDPQSLVPDRPPAKIKKSQAGQAQTPAPEPEVGVRLGTSDVRVIQRLAARTNVVPVLAKADRLTEAETVRARRGIRRSFEEMGLLTSSEEDSDENSDEDSDDPDDGTGSTASFKLSRHHRHCDPDGEWPYALVLPEAEPLSADNNLREDTDSDVLPRSSPSLDSSFSHSTTSHFQRRFKWGTLSVLNPHHCDFRQLRSSLLLRDVDEYKETTQMFYEEYRSERLQ